MCRMIQRISRISRNNFILSVFFEGSLIYGGGGRVLLIDGNYIFIAL